MFNSVQSAHPVIQRSFEDISNSVKDLSVKGTKSAYDVSVMQENSANTSELESNKSGDMRSLKLSDTVIHLDIGPVGIVKQVHDVVHDPSLRDLSSKHTSLFALGEIKEIEVKEIEAKEIEAKEIEAKEIEAKEIEGHLSAIVGNNGLQAQVAALNKDSQSYEQLIVTTAQFLTLESGIIPLVRPEESSSDDYQFLQYENIKRLEVSSSTANDDKGTLIEPLTQEPPQIEYDQAVYSKIKAFLKEVIPKDTLQEGPFFSFGQEKDGKDKGKDTVVMKGLRFHTGMKQTLEPQGAFPVLKIYGPNIDPIYSSETMAYSLIKGLTSEKYFVKSFDWDPLSLTCRSEKVDESCYKTHWAERLEIFDALVKDNLIIRDLHRGDNLGKIGDRPVGFDVKSIDEYNEGLAKRYRDAIVDKLPLLPTSA